MQYHSKATDTVCSIKLKREEFLYVGFYCTENTILFVLFLSSSCCLQQKPVSIPSFKGPEDFAAATF